ncbi:hypothetical protein HX021_08330 [Sphingobacterium sp. N143]|uniref:hypothetical protein n=1 Tax=Sphingobacterium sp. N143 TaxID=2746727 RepID=UPI0025777768|nr:hypothetical protein [Sphingobacterium sp. N143]MDM1294304.1 hypothetical protein [Sphingobacterium sp. N143]
MRLTLILIVCILLSGCGLFRKTTKINKQLDAVSVSSDVKVSTETTTGKVDKSKETSNTTSETDDKLKIFPTPGTDVKVGPDGSVTFKADSIVSYTRRKTNQARNILKDVAESFKQTKDSLAGRDSTDRRQRETKDIDQQPSATGIFSNWIGWAMGLLIVVCGIIWFLRRK